MTCERTYDELAAFASGDLAPERAAGVGAHLRQCEACRRRVAALRTVDASLITLTSQEPPDEVVLRTDQALLRERHIERAPEIMTLEEVAGFLRVPLADLEEVVAELPAFELAGRVRVRRAKLLEWIELRERRQRRRVAESQVARSLRSPLRGTAAPGLC